MNQKNREIERKRERIKKETLYYLHYRTTELKFFVSNIKFLTRLELGVLACYRYKECDAATKKRKQDIYDYNINLVGLRNNCILILLCIFGLNFRRVFLGL